MDVFASSDGTITRIAVRNESYVTEDALLIIYKEPNGDEIHVKSPSEGIVVFGEEIKKGAAMDEGTLIAKIGACAHDVVMKDMCANCGKDLREKEGRAGQRVEAATANVSMIHHVPELHVSSSLAQAIGTEDQQRLLDSRKLVLLIDLDQTIIHTINKKFNIPEEEENIMFNYSISGVDYTTRLRPHTREFLDAMAKLYELHIVTYGQRLYAHNIAAMIEERNHPTNKRNYFDQRILSRDELFSGIHKTKNLKAIFPCGEQLIVIIDDRADVWQFSEALIQVKPYRYFHEIGDINAPPNSSSLQLSGYEEEKDTCLEALEKVLTEVHKNFFNHYDKMKNIRDVKVVISYLKKQVLRDLVFVLSGVVPLNTPPEHSEIYRMCLQFGARVESTITKETTHVIAVRWGTEKMLTANRLQIPVVSPAWLIASVTHWARADEKKFEITKDNIHAPKREEKKQALPEIHGIDTIGESDLKDMEHEVDEALSGEDEDDEEEEGEGEDEGKPEDEEATVSEANTSHSSRKRSASNQDDLEDEEDALEKRQCLRQEYQDDDDDADRGEELEEDSTDVPFEEDEEDDEMAAELERQMSHDDSGED